MPRLVQQTIRLHRVQAAFRNSAALYRGFVGGRGCVAADTLIEGTPVADRSQSGLVRTLAGPTLAGASFLKGRAPLYRVATRSCAKVTVTLQHRFLTPTGWRPLASLHVGAAVAADGTLCDHADFGRPDWDYIVSIEYVKDGDYYDLHVPFWNHYAAAGLIHHNSGKSWVGAYDLIRRAKRDRTYLVASPTGTLLHDTTFPAFRQLAKDLGVWDPSQVRLSPYPTVRLTTGATVRFRTAEDPEKLKGPNLSGVLLDEAGMMAEAAYLFAIGCLREGGEQGWLSATFTPKGLTHWTYEVFASGKPHTEMFRARTADNPFLPPAFAAVIAEQYQHNPTLAAQELGGEFVSAQGAEWPPHLFDDSIWFDIWPENLTVKTLGCDPSKGRNAQHGDYSAWVLLGRDQAGQLYVEADLERRPTTKIVEDGLLLARQFRPDGIGIESDQFQELLAAEFARVSRERGIMFPIHQITTKNVPKPVRIRRLTPYLVYRNFRFKRGSRGTALLVQQLRDFPVGDHDDGPDGLEIALRLMIDLYNTRQSQLGPARLATR